MKPRLRPEELGLISVVQPKKGKNKTGALRHLGRLLNLLYEPIKALKSEKIFMGETKVRLDIVNMFYARKYHPDDSYAIVEGEKMPFTT